MTRLLLFIYFLLPLASFAGEYSWTDIEAQVLGSNLEIQAQSYEKEAAEKEANATLSPFLPNISLNAGTGQDTKLRDDNRGTQVFVEGKWNLYRGGKDTALKEKVQTVAETKKIELDIAKRNTLFKAREIFLNLLAIKKYLGIIERELETNLLQRNMAKKKVIAGLTSGVDEIEFELRDDLIAAEKHKLLSEQERESEDFRALLNSSDKIILVNGDLVVPQNRELKSVDVARAPLNIRSAQELKTANAEKSVAKSGFFPEVNLSAAYGRQTLQQDSPIKNDETTAILSISLPIFSGFETSNMVKAQNERIAAKEKGLAQVQNDLKATANNTQTRWKEIWTLYELNQKSFERAKKYYEITLGEYRRGIKNSPDLVSATERFFDAEKRMIQNAKDLNIIEAEFNKTF